MFQELNTNIQSQDGKADFSAYLHGKGSFITVYDLQKIEIRFLEQVESYLCKRAALDHEYADKVSKLHQKRPVPTNISLGEGSLLNKSWLTFIEDSEKKSNTVLQASKSLSQIVIPSVKALIVRKKQTAESFHRKTNELIKDLKTYEDEVKRLELQYKDNLKEVTRCRKKLDEIYTKAKGNKEYPKFKENLDNASRKLHMNHNEYVLALASYNEYEKRFKNTLVISIQKSLQEAQELFVQSWKEVYQNMFSQINWCSEENISSENDVWMSIEAVIPNQEYISFLERNKVANTADIPYPFSIMLAEELGNTGVKGDTLALNDLTHDQLLYKKRTVETELEDSTQKIGGKQRVCDEEKTILNGMMEAGNNKTALSTIEQSVHCNNLQIEISDLECKKSANQSRLDLITLVLATVGQGGVQSYIDLQHVEPETNIQPQKTFPHRSVKKLPDVPPKNPGIANVLNANFKQGPKTLSRPLPPPKPGAAEEPFPMFQPPGKRNNPSVSVEPQTNMSEGAPIETSIWFHGKLDRKAVASLLQVNGDFIVREKNDGSGGYVLSLYWQYAVKHFVLKREEDGYKFEGEGFDDIPSLINYYYHYQIPIQTTTGATLINPVTKQGCSDFMQSDVCLSKKLGGGHFGDVYEGIITSTQTCVAVKTCKENVPEIIKQKFLEEAEIMRPCIHENVLKLVGICKDKEPYYILLELCAKGDLTHVLRKEGVRLEVSHLYQMCVHTARGMEFLETKNIIHRDLAARNCLVTDEYVVKISDFGMSREEDNEGFYQIQNTKQIPIKWSAPEIWNFSRYSSKSDVWAYGVLLWEIFSKGQLPYPGWNNKQTTTEIDRGYRLPPPNGTPPQIGKIMEECWLQVPENRPSFTDIVNRLNQLGYLMR